MDKSFWISGISVSIAALLAGFLVHGLILAPEYAALGTVFRSEQESQPMFHWMLIAHLCMGFALTWVYRQGRREGGVFGQGIRFGLGIAGLSTVPWYLIYLAVLRIPESLAFKQIAFDVPAILAIGVLLAYLNRK